MDISLRFNKDMLVLSGPIDSALSKQGLNTKTDLSISNILEPESIEAAYRPYLACGTQCVVLNTKECLKSVLAKLKLDARLDDIAKASLDIITCQHPIVELGPSGLPLDDESRNSLIENKEQYVVSARVFEKYKDKFDAYLLSGLKSVSEIKCALMGIRQVSDKPIFVCSDFDSEGNLNASENIYDYCSTLVEFGATIVGLRIKPDCPKLCKRARAACDLPILVDFVIEDELPDDMKNIAHNYNEAGAQFLRASGNARPAHTAILVAASENLEVKWKSSF